jgi:hypothetical protein
VKDARGSGRGQLEKNIITVLSSENVLKLEKISGTKDSRKSGSSTAKYVYCTAVKLY